MLSGLFFSDENKLVYEKIKYSREISVENVDQLKMLSFKFLGPVFLAESDVEFGQWKIELIESSFSLDIKNPSDIDVIQSFFGLNSCLETEQGTTNLFTFIGSPYTEDLKLIHDELKRYIHPSIIEDRYINKSSKRQVNEELIIKNELKRGLNLINYSLGAARKIYWEEQTRYECLGVIERESEGKHKQGNLYTFDPSFIKLHGKNLPSFYVLAILPNYYEKLINETLNLFEIKGVYSNIRKIKLSSSQKKILYLEEFIISNSHKKSYGVILTPTKKKKEGFPTNIAFFRKKLRSGLDSKKNLEEIIIGINSQLDLTPWGLNSEEELNKIKLLLDKRE
ncbi:MAG: hypothetical protein ACTSXH_01190 [Promethearchaeota archaeon]